jgi:hypothetical protein
MSGSLVLVDEFTISSAVSSVTIGGGSSGSSGLNTSMDSTYDVYQLIVIDVSTTSASHIKARFTESGTANSTANYDMASKLFRTDSTYNNYSNQNQTSFVNQYFMGQYLNNAGNANGVMYIFNPSDSSEYTFVNWENTGLYSGGSLLIATQGGGVFTSSSAVDGIEISAATDTLATGQFKLYGLNK